MGAGHRRGELFSMCARSAHSQVDNRSTTIITNKVRVALQDLVRKAITQLKASVPSGDVPDVVQFLQNQLAESGRIQCDADQSPGARSVNLWMTAASASDVQRWLSSNNSADVKCHVAFISVVNAAKKKLGLGPDGCNDAEWSKNLSDCIFTLAEAIFDQVPAAVPSLAIAVVVKLSEGNSETGVADDTTTVPSFCNFLCVQETMEKVNEVSAYANDCNTNSNLDVAEYAIYVDVMRRATQAGETLQRKVWRPRNDTLHTLSTIRACYMLSAIEALSI